ncbi:MAG: MoaD/ThiS family protein [Desulfosarcinaceae bacterium]|nr:MoaD/ThiS family protein [Desulfosarcinaceae bacterium]
MKVDIKCFANLSDPNGCSYHQPTEIDVPDQTPVREILSKVGAAEADVHLVYVNGRRAAFEDTLSAGDRVGLFPPVAGM